MHYLRHGRTTQEYLFFVMEKNGVVLFEIKLFSMRSFFMSFFKIIFMYLWVFMGPFHVKYVWAPGFYLVIFQATFCSNNV